MDNKKNLVEESIKFGFFYSSFSKLFQLLNENDNILAINLKDEDLDWRKMRTQKNLSDLSIIFLDGGNSPTIIGIDLLGDDVADYVDNGGVVCTLGASNIDNCVYTVKGRFCYESYQPVRSSFVIFLKNFKNFFF